MPATPALSAPTEATLKKLHLLKGAVLLMYFTFFMRCLPDPFGALNDLLCALFGTFLLRDDTTLAGCFKCLHNSPLGMMGDGGMSCLVPFTLICMINGIMNSIKSIVLMSKWGTPLPCFDAFVCYIPLLQLVAGLAEIFACYQGWRIFQEVSGQQEYAAPQGGGWGASRPAQDEGYYPGTQRPGTAGGAGATQPFTVFEGAGHRLGDG